jgi:hypothetical protein
MTRTTSLLACGSLTIGVLVAVNSIGQAAPSAPSASAPERRTEGYLVTHAAPIGVVTGEPSGVLSVSLAPGKYLVTGRVGLQNAGAPARVRCALGNDQVDVLLNEGARPASDLPIVVMTAVDSATAAQLELKCGANGGKVTASQMQISAVGVTSLTTTNF